MKILKLAYPFIVLLGAVFGDPAWARSGHYYPEWYGFGMGLGLGYDLNYGRYFSFHRPPYRPYYSYRFYYLNTPYFMNLPILATPPVYIEQKQKNIEQPAKESRSNYWHYCHNPAGYYPYVKKCPDGWLLVTPQSFAPSTQ